MPGACSLSSLLRRRAVWQEKAQIRSTSELNPSVPSVLPVPPTSDPAHKIDERYEHRNFDQRSNRCRQGLVTLRTVGCHRNGNGKLKIIARCRKSLRRAQFIPEPSPTREPEGQEEDDDEIDEQRCRHTDDGDNLVDDLATLRGEEDNDGVEEADEGPGRQILQEHIGVPVVAGDGPEREARGKSGAQRNAEEDGHARGNHGVRYVQSARLAADDADEEDGHGRKEDHLEDRVDGD